MSTQSGYDSYTAFKPEMRHVAAGNDGFWHFVGGQGAMFVAPGSTLWRRVPCRCAVRRRVAPCGAVRCRV
eukprot:gene12902-biopygen3065